MRGVSLTHMAEAAMTLHHDTVHFKLNKSV